MTKLPTREKRRRRGDSRKENENVDANNKASNFRYEGQGVSTRSHKSASGVDEKSRRNFGGKYRDNKHSDRTEQSAHTEHNGHFSKRETSKSLSGEPQKNKQPSFGSNGESSGFNDSGNAEGRNGKKHGQMRNMRAPIQPTPVASFVNEITDKSEINSTKNNLINNTGQNGNNPNGVANGRHNGRHKGHYKKHNSQRLYAALDLGTNNCRLLIAIPQEKGRFRVIDGFSKIVRLGEGLAHSGKLSDEAMDRAVEALKVCAMKLGNHNVRLKRLIATEACRQASNGDEFIKRVREETGLKLEVINRETEARLAAEGCGALIDKKADAGVLFDIGGGSSELILVNRRQSNRSGRKRISDQIVAWTSLPVGVVTLAERYGGKTVTREVFKSMVSEVRQMLEEFPGRNELARIWKNGRVHLLGTSGTVTTLAGIHLKLARYDRRLVDGLWMSDKEIDVVLESLLGMNYQQRAASPCIGRERADLVMAGCAILEAIRITWPARRLRVADRGLREGILTQLMDRDGAWVKPKKGRWPRNRGNATAKNVQNAQKGQRGQNE